MEPEEFDIETTRGDTLPIEFELLTYDGLPLESEDYEIYFTLKKNFKTKEFILQKRKSTGEITVENNKVLIVLTHDDTAEKDYKTYVYDVQFKSGDYVKTLLKGKIKLLDESTWKANE